MQRLRSLKWQDLKIEEKNESHVTEASIEM